MKNFIKKILSFFLIDIKIQTKKSKLLAWGLHENYQKINSNQLLLKDFDLIINPIEHEFLLLGFNLLKNLKDEFNATAYFNKEKKLVIEIQNLSYNVQTYEELFILSEIFNQGVYNIALNENFILFDIGMNVAMTSLFLASRSNCIEVNAFEPFTKTYDQALYNISLNPNIKDKININNFGLGNGNYSITVTYDATIKGNMGINGVPKHLENKKTSTDEIIEIKDAFTILNGIITNLGNTSTKRILKIDCEGAEYEIFDSLRNSNLLSGFDILMIEWHYKGPETIVEDLNNAGFKHFSFNEKNRSAGMIYAFKF
ncbi:FkbM family methyltransferase [Pedobacter aquatilis]|uniref:FkbM family methyltransferase n=1 Tax=Pedobacter aquatilis TaxID=351343 RepID=UPI00292F1C6E|nr:FkbM family methyltransferase [Pedobacter aquatilis]